MSNPFVHVELSTDDVAKAKKFYKSLFGWKLSDMKMGPGIVYTTIDPRGGTGGGMMAKQGAETPTAWLAYVAVDSVKRTIAKAKKRGATILVEYQPVADMGALGVFVDPSGATLGVWEPKARKISKKAAKEKGDKKKDAKKDKSKKKNKAGKQG